jgi:ATP-dependent Clp protease, protease subunit
MRMRREGMVRSGMRAQAEHMTTARGASSAEPAPEETPNARLIDRLFKARTVLIFGEITDKLAAAVTAQLLALASESRDPIRILVNSPGGHVESGDSIHDVVRFIEPEVKMIGTGWVASAGALIFVAAKRENRVCLPNTRFLLHQPLGGVGGPASDIEIEATQILSIRERLNRTFADATGQPYEKVARETERNFWMNAREAREYGLVSRVVERSAEVG